MKKILNIGNSFFFVLSIIWFYFSIYFLFQNLSIDYEHASSLTVKCLFIFCVLLFFTFHFKNFFILFIKLFYKYFCKNKVIVLLCLIFVQIIITITSVGLAAADTSAVYNIAVDPHYAFSTNYISVNPNNYLLVIWMKINSLISKENTIVILAFWNIFFIDVSIVLVYLTNKKIFNQKLADISFIFMTFLIGLQPQYIYTYSDPITLFLVSSITLLTIYIVKNKPNLFLSSLLGILIAITYGFRPPTLVFVIAGSVVLFYKCLYESNKLILKKVVQTIAVAFLSFMIVNQSIEYSLKHQNFLEFEQNQSRTLLYYIDLGLTYGGAQHSDLPDEVKDSVGYERNIAAVQDIKNRLKDYNSSTFIGHLFFKYYGIVGEGMLGWNAERVLSEDTLLNISWLKSIQSTKISKLVRSFVYSNGIHYRFYATFEQLVWILISLGLVIFTRYYSYKNWYQLWMQISVFGGLAFLMIFEAGRSRYLIQFLPSIITVSSIGFYNLLVKKNLVKEKDEKNISHHSLL